MNDMAVWILGVATAGISILVKVVGLPDQIRQNYRRRSTKGLSVPFFVLGFIAYALWTLYGIVKNDMVVALGQGAGMITMGIVAYQMWIYRDNK